MKSKCFYVLRNHSILIIIMVLLAGTKGVDIEKFKTTVEVGSHFFSLLSAIPILILFELCFFSHNN